MLSSSSLPCHLLVLPLKLLSQNQISREIMKIFNWVHRRFNSKAEYAKKNDDIGVDDDQFQLENSCNHVFERWGGGILTIGTLGYDPLKDQNEQQNDFSYKDEEEDDVDGYDDDDDEDEDGETFVSDEELDQVESEDEEQNPLVLRYNAEVEENWNDDEEQDQLQFGYEYMMMKKQERITLADLFSADSSDKQQQQQDDDHRIVMKKQSINKKLQPQLLKQKSNRKHALSLSFANNLTAHKFNQLMRRMLKRKIHPDVGPITSKAHEVPAPANNKCRTTDDHASLLLTLQEAKI